LPSRPPKTGNLTDVDYQALAAFRLQIRRFLHFSEEEAQAEGLEAQQHQFLLAVRAGGESHAPTIGEIAGQLLIRPHSAVGLADRLVEHGLVERVRGDGDRRQVRIRLTTKGENTIARLSSIHRAELLNSGPLLVESLGVLLQQYREQRAPQRQNEDEENDVSEAQDCNL
jgi:DNA-binding MarR family transcriptional regulator